MISKTLTCLIALCGLAALCPAPIKDPEAARHVLPLQTPEQVAAEQKYDGAVPVVGSVPQKTNDDGSAAPQTIANNVGAASILANTATPDAKAKAAENLARAQQALNLAGAHGPSPLLLGLAVLTLIGGGLYGGKRYLDVNGPAPQRLRPHD